MFKSLIWLKLFQDAVVKKIFERMQEKEKTDVDTQFRLPKT